MNGKWTNTHYNTKMNSLFTIIILCSSGLLNPISPYSIFPYYSGLHLLERLFSIYIRDQITNIKVHILTKIRISEIVHILNISMWTCVEIRSNKWNICQNSNRFKFEKKNFLRVIISVYYLLVGHQVQWHFKVILSCKPGSLTKIVSVAVCT